MLEYHKAKNADATIAVLDVPKEEASRFGIMITDEDDNIIDFEEKPKNPRSTLCFNGYLHIHLEEAEKLILSLMRTTRKLQRTSARTLSLT